MLVGDGLEAQAVPDAQQFILAGGCFAEVIAEFAAVALGAFGTVAVHITIKKFLETTHRPLPFCCFCFIIAQSRILWKRVCFLSFSFKKLQNFLASCPLLC
jgi:hypothetical protein